MSNHELDEEGIRELPKPYITVTEPGLPGIDADPAVDPGFVARMQKCAERAGSVNALARKADVSQSGIRRYFSGGEPTRKVLIAIAEAAEVDLLWLATGEGAMDSEAASALQVSRAPFEASRLNADTLRLAIETVEEALAASGRRMLPESKADMIDAAYHLFMEAEGRIDKDIVLRLVKKAGFSIGMR